MTRMLPIHITLELRNNIGQPIKIVRRLNIIDTLATEPERIKQIEQWSAEAGKMLALSMDDENKKLAEKDARFWARRKALQEERLNDNI